MVGCEPANSDRRRGKLGLSAPVQAAVSGSGKMVEVAGLDDGQRRADRNEYCNCKNKGDIMPMELTGQSSNLDSKD